MSDLTDPHDMPEKPLQLGADLTRDDRTELSEDRWDAVWEHAATVEEMDAAYAELRALHESGALHDLELWQLAEERHKIEGNL